MSTSTTLRQLSLVVEPEPAPLDPNEWGGWSLFSFSKRHRNFMGPLLLARVRAKGLARKVRRKRAFVLDYYEHSEGRWALSGEAPSCRWDTVQEAGLLLWVGGRTSRTFTEWEASARAYCKLYTNWWNGYVHAWTLFLGADVVGSGDAYYDMDDLVADVRLKAQELEGEVVPSGDLARLYWPIAKKETPS